MMFGLPDWDEFKRIIRNWVRKGEIQPDKRIWLVDREGVTYLPERKIVLKAKERL